MPAVRHDGSAWLESDRKRAAFADAPIIKCAALQMKGDWAEFASTLGFPTWHDNMRPCFECNAIGSDMFVVPGNTIDSLRWLENRDCDYERACQRCEIKVDVKTIADRSELKSALRYDKRDGGSRGLAAFQDMPKFNILIGDRLEPSDSLDDVGALESVAVPCVLTFWRVKNENESSEGGK